MKYPVEQERNEMNASILILFGTESGNAEMVADDISMCFSEKGLPCIVKSMAEQDVSELEAARLAIFVTSTYGEGDMPETTEPFYRALVETRPNLDTMRFAAFGLGDSTYTNYNRAVDVLTEMLVLCGATRIGETGRHNASKGVPANQVATEWSENIIAAIKG
ncbi:flavodoxin domain-containing protein [Burkholderia sp. BCC1998]|uniref:flavodoxin domain-containing protein n=1 Tax=Burkholderia sp. BCC1998 TaxID=2817447 RepID=UPI002AB6529B|nr:flavodoxin domain-containing protein [Burkholderia sp. BCC1998]